MKASFTLMEKKLNLDQIEGKYSAYAKVPYAVPVRMSKPLAESGYGKVTVNGVEVSKGKCFFMDVIIKMHCLLIPVGEVAKEYDKEYTLKLSGFVAQDGTPFKDQEFKFHTLPRGQKNPQYAAHDEVALDAAREGMVLLKNDGHVLPLKKDSVLNCFGAAQFMFRNSSTGASLINPRWQANFHQAIAEHSEFEVNKEISELYRSLKDVLPAQEQLDDALQKSDTAVIVISRTSGEFLDNKPIKGGYYLTDDEHTMIARISKVFPKTVAIINTGYPIEMGWIEEYGINAVIYTGFAGQSAGYALVEILDGRTNPSGKLPDTWAVDYYDYPSAHNFINFAEEDAVPGEKDKGVLLYYEEDIYVGYRYFDTFGKRAAYSFGHGLSYTNFEINCEACNFDGEAITARIQVTNCGKLPGKEVVQLYMHAPDGNLEKPNRVLIGFEKTKCLQPGENQTITICASKSAFASFDEKSGSYLLEPGRYEIFCGSSLEQSARIGTFELTEAETLRKTGHINVPVEQFHKLSKENPYVKPDSKMVDLKAKIPVAAPRPEYKPEPLKAYAGKKITFPELKANHSLLDSFVAQMTDAELCASNVCGGANWYMPWDDGSAGKTVPLRKYKLPSIRVSDGNAGLNLKKPNIGMPSSTVMAATFNKELAFEVGKVIGVESRENGIAVNLGPGMNIHRNILNGRHPEYFAEDPLLAGTMAGYHGKGLVDAGTGCTYKHLFCNNSDTSRKGSHSIVSERAMREIYYRVFEVAIDIQMPTCVMTSYNAVNGIYPAENAQVLQNLVRGEWGFTGPIMTDWGTYDTVDPVEMVKAGNCWLTEGNPKYSKILAKAVKEGRLSRSVLEHNVRYLIELILKKA